MTIRFHRLRPENETRAGMSRRMFLMTTTMAGITTGSVLGNASLAASGVLDDARKASLLRMIQDIYPHPDVLSLSHYEAIAATVLISAETDAENAKAFVTVPSLIRIAFKIIVCFQRHDVPLIFILYR